MRVKFREVKFVFCGDVYSHYIKLYKRHWWSIEMDGYIPAQYELINGEYIRKL